MKDTFRSLWERIFWSEPLIGMVGGRGVGKSTLLLQYFAHHFADSSQVVYVSMDHPWFARHPLQQLADWFFSQGGTYLLLDEVHRYPDWVRAVQAVHAAYPELHLIFAGSPVLERAYRASGLSVRSTLYTLRGLSFREYLAWKGVITEPVMHLEELLEGGHVALAERVAGVCDVKQLFGEYLRQGYYGFCLSEGDTYADRVLQLVDESIEIDLPAGETVERETVRKARRLLMMLAEGAGGAACAGGLNVSALCAELDVSRNHLLKLFGLLERVGLVQQVFAPGKAGKEMKPERVIFSCPDLLWVLGDSRADGYWEACRVSFFVGMLRDRHQVYQAGVGDFEVDGEWLFGVSVRAQRQVKRRVNGFCVTDEVIGAANSVPLWCFGMLY